MTDYAATRISNFDTLVTETITPPEFVREAHYLPADSIPVGNRVAGAPGGAAIALHDDDAVRADVASLGNDWFERIHILPRAKIEFGNIVTTVTAEFEIFNAYRSTTSVLTAFTNNAGAGIEIPDLPTLPYSLPPLLSLLDPSSTPLVPVRLVVSAGPDGAPLFDGTLDFTFSTGDSPFLSVSGARIVLFSAQPESPATELWEFRTRIDEHLDGTEQRESLRKRPRQVFRNEYLLDGDERQRLQVQLFGWQASVFAVPVWHEQTETTAAASIGATTLSVLATTDYDYRVGGLAVVFESPTKFDVLVVSAVTSTSVSFATTPLTQAYSTRATVMPVRVCTIRKAVTASRLPVKVERVSIEFETIDNDTGAMSGSTSGWSTHGGKVLLDDSNFMLGEVPETYEQRTHVLDNGTGVPFQSSRWTRHKRAHQRGFVARTQAEIAKVKRLLLSLDGRRVSFWIPTFIEDLTVVASLAATTSVMDIGHIGYARFAAGIQPKATFRITFADGSSLLRTVLSAVEVSATVERLTLDTTWPTTRTAAEVVRVEFFEQVRFASDVFAFEFVRPSAARLYSPLVTVF